MDGLAQELPTNNRKIFSKRPPPLITSEDKKEKAKHAPAVGQACLNKISIRIPMGIVKPIKTHPSANYKPVRLCSDDTIKMITSKNHNIKAQR